MKLAKLTALLLATACGGAPRPGPVDGPAPPIAWRDWSAAVFEQARAEDRMVLVDVGIEGCTACRWMYEDTYRHPGVRRRLADHFLAVAVDAGARPDIGARFERWAWPATVVFSPSGERVVALRGNRRPRSFLPVLDELIRRHAEGTLRPLAEGDEPPEPEGELGALCASVLARLDARADTEHGGWERRPRGPRAAPVRHAMIRAHARGEHARRDHALRTAEGHALLLDPVWGGVFVAALDPAWSEVIVEKRLRQQASAMASFAEAFMATGDRTWLAHAAEVHRYVREVLTAPDGTFYATQEDAAQDLPEGTSARDYYRLSDAERRRLGVPPIDHAVLTDLNGRMIEAYARLYEASGDEAALAAATRAADALLASRSRRGGWIAQAAETAATRADARMRPLRIVDAPYLAAQASFGAALVRLHAVTFAPRYLEAAVGVAGATREHLEDRARGGFHAGPDDGTGASGPRHRPLRDNGLAARFLLELSFFTRDEALADAARRALRVASAPARLEHAGVSALGEIALAHELAALGPVEISIVARPDDPAAQPLLRAARAVSEPRRLVHFEPDGRYPMADRPSLFVCDRSACSTPVFEPDQVAAVVAQFQDASRAPCRSP